MKRDDVAVVGSGAAGLTAAMTARRRGARVVMLESRKIGGECTHFGCVPSKALLSVAKLAEAMRGAPQYALPGFDPSMSFDFLADVTAVHWPDDEKPMELVYHLYSYGSDERLRLKVRAAEGQSVPSLCPVWRSANWNDREAWDMFGIRFDGHPDLRRILMPEDYTDHPLRKEFPLYRG